MTITLAPKTEARVLAAAARRNEAPEAIIDAALGEYIHDEPEPYDSPARTYYRESEYGKILAEKFRKQGLNVD